MPSLLLIYDGHCPLCATYVRMARLRSQFDLQLVDGREAPVLVASYAERGYPLDNGLIVEIDGTIYFGAEAIWFLANISSNSDAWNRLNRWVFSSPARARAIYPGLRYGRMVLVRLLGRYPIAPFPDRI